MKNKKLLTSISLSIFLLLIIVVSYFIFSYSNNLNKFKEDLSSNNYEDAAYCFNNGTKNIILKKTFIKSSEDIITEKLSEIENEYYSGDISQEETIKDLNGLLSLNTSNEEILNFKNTLPLIKDSKDSFDIGISKLDEGNYLEALNYFKSVHNLSDCKPQALEYEETCLDKIREPILKTVDEYISNEKYSKGIEYLDSQINFLPDDPKLQEKRDELEKLRLEHLEDYSQKNIDKATARTAPVMEYYKKLNEDTINQFDITSNTNYLVFVNIAEQKTYVYEGSKNDWTLDKTFTCSTGIEGKETPVGVFTVQNRAPWFFSPKYGQGGKYYVQFMGNYLFHSIPFDSDRTTVSDPTLGVPSSHGCIRLSVEDSKWLYDNVQNGSKIIIY
ncbi:L,D-transpeptidase family protein [Clostridium perfringens]|jgi:tetratricopeptide (TPR) repeat protein|uniref:L,D-transpeptidase n=1 Tax=Clostridium perfringens TaxID=1502 RepID=UPI000E4A8260|nr:L,D-transpeptidase [Clostridium perfringens]MDK0578198.1 L,D-transpeptidase family protein [Clostridium perfringens]MDK0581096.1 L,D-transpeptidase family protein [Clostridium perfringens]MDK0678242.1 L,D-transpeptidase family protein [Clostridium perfringens]MDK0719555.1 L,D-transpeptidase family protein [Clostridium perfringens]MDK0730894.1 L,D-transpeptidase family protein [Clostridium perfringens]